MKLNYRPEIDGLRGIAVVLVILYHAEIYIFDQNFFSGGFIGVDIFFVISGYLITSLILKELNLTGRFNFIYFYERRARRLLPVLFTVMFVSIPFAWIYLLPIPFKDFSNSILSSIFFGSNFYFYYSGTIYGAESGLLKPFLHTWSLSVEEQFYLFFPVFLFFCYSFFRKYIIHIVVILFFLSICFASWGSTNFPSLNFYILPTRGWELLAGAFLAKLETFKIRPANKKINEMFIFLGLILIGYSVVFFNDKMFHPSFYTLPPIIGVMLIIWFSNKEEIITKILSSKFFVGTGLISYSLYLWHFPIFSFSRIKHPSISDYDKLEIIVASILLSILSFFLIEKPFRNKKTVSKKFLLTSLLSGAMVLILYSFSTIKNNGFEDRLHVFLKKELKRNPWEILKDENGLCFDRIDNHCSFNKDNSKKIYLIGDSYMESISNKFYNKLKDKKINYISINRTGCFYLPNFDKVEKKTGKIVKNCSKEVQSDIRSRILLNKNSIVVIGASYNGYLKDNWEFEMVNKQNAEGVLEGLVNTINELLENDLYVVLIYPIPELDFNLPKKLMTELPKSTFNASVFLKNNPLSIPYEKFKQENNKVFEALNQLSHKNLTKIYPDKLFCDTEIANRCITHDDKNIFYFDDRHLSSKGSEILVNEIYLNIKELIN